MAVKATEGRWRYIAFRVEAEDMPGRGELLSAILDASRRSGLGGSLRMTVYEDGLGILKVPHRMKESAIEVLNSVEAAGGRPVKLVPLKTSGTIRSLKRRYRSVLGTQRNISD